MAYKVITNFTDLQDDNHKYIAGDTFPRSGYEPSPERLKELSTSKNRRGKPVIAMDVPDIPDKGESPVEIPKKPKKGGKKKNAN